MKALNPNKCLNSTFDILHMYLISLNERVLLRVARFKTYFFIWFISLSVQTREIIEKIFLNFSELLKLQIFPKRKMLLTIKVIEFSVEMVSDNAFTYFEY